MNEAKRARRSQIGIQGLMKRPPVGPSADRTRLRRATPRPRVPTVAARLLDRLSHSGHLELQLPGSPPHRGDQVDGQDVMEVAIRHRQVRMTELALNHVHRYAVNGHLKVRGFGQLKVRTRGRSVLLERHTSSAPRFAHTEGFASRDDHDRVMK